MGLTAAEAAQFHTPQSHIDAVRTMCATIKAHPAIKDVVLNDWGRFSNFEVFVYPHQVGGVTAAAMVRRVVAAAVPRSARVRQVFSPTPVYRWGRKAGYDRDFYAVDVDFHHYDVETNRFDGGCP